MKTITRGDYLKLVGLLTLAQHHNRAIQDIIEAAEDLTGEAHAGRTGSSHAADEVVGGNGDALNADRLLKKLGITVEGS